MENIELKSALRSVQLLKVQPHAIVSSGDSCSRQPLGKFLDSDRASSNCANFSIQFTAIYLLWPTTMAQKCVHKGCGKTFTDPEEDCIFHPGPPIFHEGQKGVREPSHNGLIHRTTG